jgi:uncharacterized protein YecE (DUF72 family)
VSGEVRIGTSGWNYPSGAGTWDGAFYPARRGRDKRFDELAFYAAHFNTVEVNSTFYGQPRAGVSESWVRRTPAGFEFSVKLYQKFTHPGMYMQRLGQSLSGLPGEAPDAAALQALAKPNQEDLDAFKRGIEPLAASGKLGALLAQFPPSFKYGDAECAYLTDLIRAFGSYPVAVELRHRSWSDHFGETLALLNAFDAAWAQIDEPKFRFSIRQNFLPNVRGFYYMRLHGRNSEQWWHHEKSEDRYNYLYSARELEGFVETARAARELVRKIYLYTNNHASARSVANAAMIKQQLGEPLEGEYPEEFIARYPELAPVSHATPARTPS